MEPSWIAIVITVQKNLIVVDCRELSDFPQHKLKCIVQSAASKWILLSDMNYY